VQRHSIDYTSQASEPGSGMGRPSRPPTGYYPTSMRTATLAQSKLTGDLGV
jgi:hypothetical protein